MIKSILRLIVLVIFMTACNGESIYAPKNLKEMTQDQVLEMAKNKTFPTPANVVYKDPKGATLTLDSLGKIQTPSDYYQIYYRDDAGVIKEVVIKKATDAEKAFNEKVMNVYSGKE